MTLRRRVLAYVAGAALASCALTVLVGTALVRHQISARRVTALERVADVLATVGVVPGALGPGLHVYSAGSGTPRQLGSARAERVLAAVPVTKNAEGTVNIQGRDILFAERSTPSGQVVVVRPAAFAFSEWRPFLGSLLLAGLGGALVAALLSFLLARRLTRPIAELSAATGRLAAGERDVLVPVRGEDELADLGTAFNAMSGELGRAREAQRSFLESVSHELKTPLTSIRGYAEAVQEGAVSPPEGTRVIAAEADRLERLVGDLLDLARFGREDFAVEHNRVDLADVVRRAVERYRPRAEELSVALAAAGAERGDGAWALGDADRLLQATSNLIENALRITPAGGSVTARAAPGLIAVTDTGPGLSAEDLPHAFERFYLHDRYRSERSVGSGLGLAIVHELVSAMGGTVEASTPAEGGARFTLRLPVG